jgi:hypothetical protein
VLGPPAVELDLGPLEQRGRREGLGQHVRQVGAEVEQRLHGPDPGAPGADQGDAVHLDHVGVLAHLRQRTGQQRRHGDRSLERDARLGAQVGTLGGVALPVRALSPFEGSQRLVDPQAGGEAAGYR